MLFRLARDSAALRPRVRIAALVVGVLLCSRGASANPPPLVRLIYERAPNAADCPDREAVLNAVRARLGFDPFREPAEITIRAQVSRNGDELLASILLTDPDHQEGQRTLVSRRADCTELASAMDLALSIAIDPLSVTRQSSPPQSIIVVPMTTTSTYEPPRAAPVPPPISAPSKHVEAAVGAAGSLGTSIAPTLGFYASVALRGQAWSLLVEGRADLPNSRPVGGGSIEVSSLVGTVAPCLHRGPFGGCVLAAVAALRGAGRDLEEARHLTTTSFALGARVLGEWPGSGPIAFRAHLDLASPLSRTTLKVGDKAVWTSPPISLALGLGAVLRFL